MNQQPHFKNVRMYWDGNDWKDQFMGDLYVLWNVYNEVENLPEALDHVERLYPRARHIISDGRYTNYGDNLDPMFSTDGTTEIVMTRAWEWDLVWAMEPRKRTGLFELADMSASIGDWCLILDADERLTELELPDDDARVLHIEFTRVSDGMKYTQARGVRWEPGLHYKHKHFWLYDKDDNRVLSVVDSGEDVRVDGKAVHLDMPRSPEREETEAKYYRWLQDYESMIKEGK